MKSFKLSAEIVAKDPARIGSVLTKLFGVDGIIRTSTGFKVKTTMEGQDIEELNSELLSALRRVDKEVVLRAEWTEQSFEYVVNDVRKG